MVNAGEVLVVGSINVDLVVRAPRLPAPGETVSGGTFARHHGGKGANQAVAAARAGATVTMIGAVGDDEFGQSALVDLSRPADRCTHLGRLVEAVAEQGLGAFETVVTRKLGANLTVIASSVWTAMVPIALGFVVYLLWRAPGVVRSIRETIKESLPGLLVVGVLGFALNDSGIAVPGVMLGVINPSLVYLTVRTLPAETAG